jgi:hypothetical protein
MDLTKLLKEEFKDLLTEESLQTIQEAFDSAVKKATEDRLELEVKAIDEDHADKLKALVESIDEDHTAKMKKLVEAIDKDHAYKLKRIVEAFDKKATSKLKQVAEAYKTKMKRLQEGQKDEAKAYKAHLEEQLSNYIDLYIDEVLPKKQIEEAVQNITAKKRLEEVRSLIGVTEEFVDNEVKEALKDGAKTIKALKEQVEASNKERLVLKEKLNAVESRQLLAEKTQGMPKDQKEFVKKMFSGKDATYISENFQYAVDLFEKQLNEDVESEGKRAKRKVLTESSKDRVIKDDIESHEISNTTEMDSEVSGYLNEMKKMDGFGRR